MFWNGDNLYAAKNHKHRTACALSESLSVQMSKTQAKRPRVSERERERSSKKNIQGRVFHRVFN